jgi:putative ABC transport system substrate-binding protein
LRLRFILLPTLVVLSAAIAFGLGWTPAPRVKVVAVLTHGAVAERSFAGLREGLAERGWHEGETIRYLYDGPEPSPERLAAQAKEHLRRKIDLVVALSTPAALAARAPAEAAGVPLLLAPASDPVASGLVSSLTHPHQAVTGVTFALQEPRRLEWLARLVPSARTIWIPFNHADPSPRATLARLGEVAGKLGLTLVTADVRSAEQLHAALAALPREVDAIFMPPDALLSSHAEIVLAAAAERSLPVTTPHRHGVAMGALFSYGFDLTALGRQAARLADRILNGTPAANLPIEAAEMTLSINIATADRLGLAIPDDVLAHAVLLDRPGG